MLYSKQKKKSAKNYFAKQYRLPRLKSKIERFAPKNPKAKVLILNLNSNPVRAPGKVDPEIFFPPFSSVLAACGVSTAYVSNKERMEREILESDRIPVILVNLIHELDAENDRYDIPENLANKFRAIFNRHKIAKIIGDKVEANIFFTKHDISMPRLRPNAGKVFSNTRFGSHDKVLLYESIDDADSERYNTELIDTKIKFRGATYFTCIRLICIGTRVLQIYVRARDVNENDPSVHNQDTPKDGELIVYLYDRLVAPRLEEFYALGSCLGNVLGPGFYVHDVLVDRNSGQLNLCESGFKFYDDTYSEHMMGVIPDQNIRCNILDQGTFAGYAGSVFVTCCAEMGFF